MTAIASMHSSVGESACARKYSASCFGQLAKGQVQLAEIPVCALVLCALIGVRALELVFVLAKGQSNVSWVKWVGERPIITIQA
jgi:hypothetical protein